MRTLAFGHHEEPHAISVSSSEPPIIGAELQLGGTGSILTNQLQEELRGENGLVTLGVAPLGTTIVNFAPIGATLNVLQQQPPHRVRNDVANLQCF
jgi:hypothetical protein